MSPLAALGVRRSTMTHRILIIEDDAHIGEMLRQALTREGYEVEWVTEGEPALKSATISTPDLILLDLKWSFALLGP
ncbi:MAG: response regulator [Actinomycetota bacterium]|nr:response regulator [Actinomycetota bacterium]